MNTQVFYCPKCALKHRPQLDDLFVTVGNKDQFIVHVVQYLDKMSVGFTPHIIKMTKSENGVVHFTYRCGMQDCGVIIELNEAKRTAMAWEIKNTELKGVMPVKDFNAMISYRDSDYELD